MKMLTVVLIAAFAFSANAQSSSPSSSPSPTPALTKEEIVARFQAKLAAKQAADYVAKREADQKAAMERERLSKLTHLKGTVSQNVGNGLLVEIVTGYWSRSVAGENRSDGVETRKIFLRGHPLQNELVDGSRIDVMGERDGIYHYESVGAGTKTVEAFRYSQDAWKETGPFGNDSKMRGTLLGK